MYLSRLILNLRSREVRRDLSSPYELHRSLLRAFPDGSVHQPRTADDAAGVLFRLEQIGEAAPQLLVQSQQPPDWRRLASGYLLEDADNPAVKEFQLELSPGQLLAFRLVANPTKRLGKSMGKDQGKRVGIYEEQKQSEWLQRKAEQAGFQLIDLQIRDLGKATGKIPSTARAGRPDSRVAVSADGSADSSAASSADSGAPSPGVHAAQWLMVQFDGLLQVTAPDLLVGAVQAGIGGAKSVGCGLLSLAPAR